MSMKFRRSKKIAPGVKVNLNKSSASVTVGGKLARVTKSTNGNTTVGASIPGTGVYFSERSGATSDVAGIELHDSYIGGAESAHRKSLSRAQRTAWRIALGIFSIAFLLMVIICMIRVFRAATLSAIVFYTACAIVFSLLAVKFGSAAIGEGGWNVTRRIFILFAASLCFLLVACSPTTSEPAREQSPSQDGQQAAVSADYKTVDECYQHIFEVVADSEHYGVGLNEAKTEITIFGTTDGVANCAYNAIDGLADATEQWKSLTDDMVFLCNSAKDYCTQHGQPSLDVVLYVFDTAEETKSYLAVRNGVVFHDAVAVGKQQLSEQISNDEMLSVFDAVCEHTGITKTVTTAKTEVHIRTDFTADSAPKNWDSICNALLSALDEYANGQTVSAQIEAADGTILANAFKGRIIYDKYGRGHATPDASESPSRSAGQMVYVTPNGTHYHKTRICGGENSYAISISNVGSRTACSKCW